MTPQDPSPPMRLRPMTAILSLAAAALGSIAAPAAARPYLMLYADDKGFQALDIGDFVRTPVSPYADDRILTPAGGLAQESPATTARLDNFPASGPRLVDPRTQGALAPGEGAARIVPRAAAHPLFVPDRVEATLISAPLAGAPYGDKLAPMVKQRAEFDCREPRWRVLSRTYTDAHEAVLGTAVSAQEWLPLDVDPAAVPAQAALCKRQYRQAAVSRFLNVGEILANYQAAHGAGVPQPKTREQRLAERFKNSR